MFIDLNKNKSRAITRCAGVFNINKEENIVELGAGIS
jgi:hypothetical protein